MTRLIVPAVLFCLVLGCGDGAYLSPKVISAESDAITITVSPNTLILDSQGVWVTVHTDIPYSQVDGVTVTLNGIEVAVTKADARGDFVAKFELDAVKDIVAPPEATLVLEGLTKDGVAFTGADTIRVSDGR